MVAMGERPLVSTLLVVVLATAVILCPVTSDAGLAGDRRTLYGECIYALSRVVDTYSRVCRYRENLLAGASL